MSRLQFAVSNSDDVIRHRERAVLVESHRRAAIARDMRARTVRWHIVSAMGAAGIVAGIALAFLV